MYDLMLPKVIEQKEITFLITEIFSVNAEEIDI